MKLLAIIFILTSTIFASETKISDINIIEEKLIQENLNKVPAESANIWLKQEFDKFQKNFDESDGKFSDLDYKDPNNVTWGAFHHAIRLWQFTLAYRTPQHYLYNNAQILKIIKKGIKFLAKNNFENHNWWMNEIGVPLRTYAIQLMLKNELSQDLADSLMLVTNKALRMSARTGQNLLWFSEIHLGIATLTNDTNLMRRAAVNVRNELVNNGSEGIRSDQSFYQHGPVFYNGGYGTSYAMDITRFVKILAETEFEFNSNELDIIANYLLDGQRWIIAGKFINYSAAGRYYARPGFNALNLLEAFRNFSTVTHPRSDEIKLALLDIQKQKLQSMHGNKYFYNGNFMVQNTADFNFSVKTYSDKTLNADTTPNKEGIFNDYISNGVTYLFRKGDEYTDIFPLLDYTKLPGITSTDEILLGLPDQRFFNASKAVGGVSNSKMGLSYMKLKHGKLIPSPHYTSLAEMDFATSNLEANKSWFFTQDGLFALGSGITHSGASIHSVNTSIEQCWSKGAVQVKNRLNQPKIFNNQEANLTSNQIEWVHHNELFYINFDSTNSFKISSQMEEGRWTTIAPQQKNDLVSGNVFSINIDHGLNPNNAKYAYMVTNKLQESSNYNLVNTESMQAIANSKMKYVMAIIYKENEALKLNNLNLKANFPISFIWDESDKIIKLTVSSYQRKQNNVIEINGKYSCRECKYLENLGVTKISLTQGLRNNGDSLEINLSKLD